MNPFVHARHIIRHSEEIDEAGVLETVEQGIQRSVGERNHEDPFLHFREDPNQYYEGHGFAGACHAKYRVIVFG